MNNLLDFARLVLRMRRAQKDLKKYNTRAQQQKVETLEREVDIELEKMVNEGQKIKQMQMNAKAGGEL